MTEPRRYSAEEIELILEKVMLNWHNNVYNHVYIIRANKVYNMHNSTKAKGYSVIYLVGFYPICFRMSF